MDLKELQSKDVQAIIGVLKEMGVEDYEPRVVNQLIEFSYSMFLNYFYGFLFHPICVFSKRNFSCYMKKWKDILQQFWKMQERFQITQAKSQLTQMISKLQ
jgi:hypothetical protein